MDGYLVKPVARDALDAVLREWIVRTDDQPMGIGTTTDSLDAQQSALLDVEILRELVGDDAAVIAKFWRILRSLPLSI